MKKTGLVMASIMGAVLLLGIFGYSLVAAQEDEVEDEDDSESSSQIEIEVKIVNDAEARVEAHYNGVEEKFTLDTSDIEDIISEIADRTGLTSQQVQSNLHLETEIETEDEIEDESDDESDDDDTPPGAEVRLNQLQKHLEKAIARENNAISAVQANAPNASVNNLQATVNSTQTVLNNVNTAITNLPTTSNQDAVNLFTDLKNQAINLFHQFRQQFKSLLGTLTTQQKQQIKQQLHPLEASSD